MIQESSDGWEVFALLKVRKVNNKIIIAGADGYIGQRMQKLVLDKTPMLLLSPLTSDSYVPFNLLDLSKFNFSLISAGDTVVLLAGISSPDLCTSQYRMAFDINVTGTIRFINACLKNGAKVLFFSSDTVYGNSPSENDEDMFPSQPVGEYGTMKFLVERYFKGEPGFKSFRLSYVFSWNDRYTTYLRSCLEQNRKAEVFDPLVRRAVYIDDLIACVLNIAGDWENHRSQFFNICGPQYISRVEIANCFSRYAGKLDIHIIRPDESFYHARPAKIRISSKYSESLLGKGFTTIEDAIRIEMHNFSN
jgi:dTDP-4-dehydrorhamnose reductase